MLKKVINLAITPWQETLLLNLVADHYKATRQSTAIDGRRAAEVLVTLSEIADLYKALGGNPEDLKRKETK